MTSGNTFRFPLAASAISSDYPFACPSRVVGNSYETLEQSGPWCSGACPAGFACPGGTLVPEVCPAQHYCPKGSATGELCEAGTWSNRTGLAAATDCTSCQPGAPSPLSHSCSTSAVYSTTFVTPHCPLYAMAGHWCSGGAATPCEIGFYNEHARANSQSACRICPPQSSSPRASRSLFACQCNPGYYNDDRDGVHCVPCILGSSMLRLYADP